MIPSVFADPSYVFDLYTLPPLLAAAATFLLGAAVVAGLAGTALVVGRRRPY